MNIGDFVFIKVQIEDEPRLYNKSIINNIEPTIAYKIVDFWEHPLFGLLYKLSGFHYKNIHGHRVPYCWFRIEDLVPSFNFIND